MKMEKKKKKKSEKIDFDGIVQAADPCMVFQEVGMHLVYRNGKPYILCPGHRHTLGRDDRRIGSCLVTPKGCYCYACGRGYDTVESVAYFLNTNIRDAAKCVADICGIDAYSEANTRTTEYRLLKGTEMEMIGLSTRRKGYGAITNLAYLEENVPRKNGKEDTPRGLCTYVSSPVQIDIRSLAIHDSETYRWLVFGKIKETMAKYMTLNEFMQNPTKHLPLIQTLSQAGISLQDMRQTVKEILYDLEMLAVEFSP